MKKMIHAKFSGTLLLLSLFGLAVCGAVAAQEVGPDDLQISVTGAIGDPAADALDPDVAYDRFHNRFMSVWSADDVDGDHEIYGRLMNAYNQDLAASQFMISPGDTLGDAYTPAVIYNPYEKEYLVVWSSDDGSPAGFEIFGQRLTHAGLKVGGPFAVSSTADTDSIGDGDALTPDVIWMESSPGYLVVWAADDGVLSGDGHFRILGRMLATNDAAPVGDAFMVSDPDPLLGDALAPALAVNDVDTEFMVAYEQSAVDSLSYPEIFVRRLDTAGPIGVPARISCSGLDEFDARRSKNPQIIHNLISNVYLAVWDADKDIAGRFGIYGQLLDATGAEIGTDDFMISYTVVPVGKYPIMGSAQSINPAVSFNRFMETYLVVWEGDPDGSRANNSEIFCRHIYGDGQDAGAFEGPISDMGLYELPDYNAHTPAVVFNSDNDVHLAVWAGDLYVDGSTPVGEKEIYAQAWSLEVTAIDDGPEVPQPVVYDFALLPNSPNPFNPSTRIDYTLPAASLVRLEIYDVAGRLIKRLVNEYKGPGRHSATWNGDDVLGRSAASGTYIGRLTADNLSESRTLNLVK